MYLLFSVSSDFFHSSFLFCGRSHGIRNCRDSSWKITTVVLLCLSRIPQRNQTDLCACSSLVLFGVDTVSSSGIELCSGSDEIELGLFFGDITIYFLSWSLLYRLDDDDDPLSRNFDWEKGTGSSHSTLLLSGSWNEMLLFLFGYVPLDYQASGSGGAAKYFCRCIQGIVSHICRWSVGDFSWFTVFHSTHYNVSFPETPGPQTQATHHSHENSPTLFIFLSSLLPPPSRDQPLYCYVHKRSCSIRWFFTPRTAQRLGSGESKQRSYRRATSTSIGRYGWSRGTKVTNGGKCDRCGRKRGARRHTRSLRGCVISHALCKSHLNHLHIITYLENI